MAFGPFGVLPIISTVGIVATHAITAQVVWLAFSRGYVSVHLLRFHATHYFWVWLRLVWYMIRYGDCIMAFLEMGFFTAENTECTQWMNC